MWDALAPYKNATDTMTQYHPMAVQLVAAGALFLSALAETRMPLIPILKAIEDQLGHTPTSRETLH